MKQLKLPWKFAHRTYPGILIGMHSKKDVDTLSHPSNGNSVEVTVETHMLVLPMFEFGLLRLSVVADSKEIIEEYMEDVFGDG